jgi:hypothetical protein
MPKPKGGHGSVKEVTSFQAPHLTIGVYSDSCSLYNERTDTFVSFGVEDLEPVLDLLNGILFEDL